MPLQMILSGVYQVIRHSWMISTVVVKYILAVHLVQLLRQENLDPESFQQKLMEYSSETVAGIIALGAVFATLQIEVSAGFMLFSQLVALAYFGFLFWKY